jgi:preprotein translocase subunit SecA
MNIQRGAIYSKRNNALSGDRLSVDINNMFTSMTESLVADYKGVGDYDAFRNECLRVLGVDPTIEAADFAEGDVNELVERLQDQVSEQYQRKGDRIAHILAPLVENVFTNEGHRYKRIAIPFTDGRQKPLPISADLKDAVDTKGGSIMNDIEKAVTLAIIDENWKEHLRSMDELKDAVQTASFEQKDPLVVYKMEAYKLFEELIYKVNEETCAYLMKGNLVIPGEGTMKEARVEKTDLSNVRTSREEQMAKAAAQGVSRRPAKPETFKRQEKKVGRNEPCPCGSGKKYKHCHGKG